MKQDMKSHFSTLNVKLYKSTVVKKTLNAYVVSLSLIFILELKKLQLQRGKQFTCELLQSFFNFCCPRS